MSGAASKLVCNPFPRWAFSLVEVLVATILMGVLLVAALRTVGGSVRAAMANADRGIGLGLAEGLMAEILTTRYVEPTESPVFGPEASETGGSRAAFDDVDDYQNWDAWPPEDRDGTPIPDRADWRRQVTVEYVASDDLTTAVGGDQGVKRITVTVSRGSTVVASLVGFRTDTD